MTTSRIQQEKLLASRPKYTVGRTNLDQDEVARLALGGRVIVAMTQDDVEGQSVSHDDVRYAVKYLGQHEHRIQLPSWYYWIDDNDDRATMVSLMAALARQGQKP